MPQNAAVETTNGGVPAIAIVGRPNVGKSSLFNTIVGRRLSIVHEMSGVTRDRVVAPLVRNGRRFELIDTGGWACSPESPAKWMCGTAVSPNRWSSPSKGPTC
ncbi:MAG: 50S ribosome-binding GTPase [Lentisphaeria bacterium]|nr:MAG: 50S ribosome-binding GTPase [Lentisphaeria bacterium]